MFVVMVLGACDGMIAHKKRYYFALTANGEKSRELLNFYFYKFNSNFNVDVLKFLPPDHHRSDDEVSTILMVPRMSEREGEDDGTLGWGQWRTCVKMSSFKTLLVSPHKMITKIHTMHLEFDVTRFTEWHYSDKLAEREQAESLFLHEIGHGFHLDHDPDKNAVMYENINDAKKNHQKYYDKVAKFLEE